MLPNDYSDFTSVSDPELLALLIVEDTSLDELETRVIISVDLEVERAVHEFDDETGRSYFICFDDNVPVSNSGCYWTTTGDNPVIDCIATSNDNRDRNLNEIPSPNKNFYSVAKPNPNDKLCYRNYMKSMLALRKYASDKAHLRRLWRRFWKKFFALKQSDKLDTWLKPWHIKRIRLEFNRLGITKQGR